MSASFDESYPPDGTYGSYSAASQFGETLESSFTDDDTRPRILMVGLRRSGKSSIQKVVFQKMSPHETLFLEGTGEIRNRDISTSALVQVQLLDFPGDYDFQDHKARIPPEKIFKKPGAVVFVIDAQDEEAFAEAIEDFVNIASLAVKHNPKLHFEVLIHKVDGDAYLSDEHKAECQNELKKSITEELEERRVPVRPVFHLTSIYDHTIFEAFSKIVQKLIPQLAHLEKMLDSLIGNCGMEKAFLFDIVSKIYVATDSNPVDMQTYELCSDMIDVVIDVSCIYGTRDRGDMLVYGADSASVIRLSNDYVLYLREASKYLVLVCLMRKESYDKAGLIEYNFSVFRKAITDMLEAKKLREMSSSEAKMLKAATLAGLPAPTVSTATDL